MSNLDKLAERAFATFKSLDSRQTAVPQGLTAPPSVFSLFIPEHARRAIALAQTWMEVADMAVDDEAALLGVLDAADALRASEPPGLIKHALSVFMTHHERGRRLRIPPLELRAPDKIAPSPKPPSHALSTGGEAALDYWREDPLANEHHEHWHDVYPNFPDSGPLKERHGELFLYMHEQMLARYDAERLAAGLTRVQPFDRYEQSMGEGYDPGPLVPQYASRPANATMVPSVQIEQSVFASARQAVIKALFDDAIEKKRFLGDFGPVSIDSDRLGATIETSAGSAGRRYGNFHGNGHVQAAFFDTPIVSPNSVPGVMIDTATAIRDPFFWRWHKHIDDIGAAWADRQPPHEFAQNAPRAHLRKGATAHASPDIILAFRDRVPGADAPGFDGAKLGDDVFGGAAWDTDFAAEEITLPDGSKLATTRELETFMRTRKLTLSTGNQVDIQYLAHREFFYFLRIENELAVQQAVTVRIFLAPEQVADDRRGWIEMDKFTAKLPPSAKTVVFRPTELSSVVLKPAIKDPEDPPLPPTAPPGDANYCQCGWPFTMLLPRGTQAGMNFRLLVMLTDWAKDKVGPDTACGSMSYCGVRDKYPDQRPMGYPFDRNVATSIEDMIASEPNIATREITIRWV